MIRLGRGWYLMRWPYRRRYADYLWTSNTTRTQKTLTRLRETGHRMTSWIPWGVRRLDH